jgi:hypothetical protein
MSGKLFDYDPIKKITETFHKTDSGFVIKTSQDVEPILNQAKLEKSHDPGNYRNKNYHLEAIIPDVVIEQWRKELGDDPLASRNRKWFLAKLNDRDNQMMRTRNTKL